MKKNNYLITGGLGFIGSTITKMLVNKKDTGKCIIVDNYTNYINPLRWTFADYRKLRFTNIKDKKFKKNIQSVPTVSAPGTQGALTILVSIASANGTATKEFATLAIKRKV